MFSVFSNGFLHCAYRLRNIVSNKLHVGQSKIKWLILFQAVPDGIKTEISQLSGLILIDDSRDPQIIKRFSERDLPIDIAERLNVLFNAREKWTLDEITPFVNSLTTNKLNVNALLTKYARALNIGGKKLFCAKHGKQ